MGFVQIPVDALSRQALDGLIEEFLTRDGTDYTIVVTTDGASPCCEPRTSVLALVN